MAKKSNPARLSEEQIPLWAASYIKDFNATRVALELGYSEKGAQQRASEIMDDPRVQIAVSRAVEERKVRCKLEADDILMDLKVIKDRCMQAEPVLDNEGCPTGEWKFNADAAIKALALYGKHLGMFSEKGGGDAFEPLILNLPGVNQTIMVTNGGPNGRYIPAAAAEGAVQNVPLLQPNVGESVAGGVPQVPAPSGDVERT